jgi:hypothetical protein
MLRAVAKFGAVSIGGFLRRGRDRISRRVTPLSALTGAVRQQLGFLLALAV